MEEIKEGDFQVFEQQAQKLAQMFCRSFAEHMYRTVGDGAESVGNTVHGEGKSFPDQFIEMLEKIEFGVDKQGVPTLPEIHASPEYAQKMLDALNAQGPEYSERVEQIKERKSAAALERERERKSRFKKHD